MTGKFYPPAIIRSVTKDRCISYLLPCTTSTLFAQSISIGNGILNEEEEGDGRFGWRPSFLFFRSEVAVKTAYEMRVGPEMDGRKHKKATAI